MTYEHGKESVGLLAAPTKAFALQRCIPVLGNRVTGKDGKVEEDQSPNGDHSNERDGDTASKAVLSGIC